MYVPYNQCQLKTVSYLVRQVWQHVTNNTFPRPLGVTYNYNYELKLFPGQPVTSSD